MFKDLNEIIDYLENSIYIDSTISKQVTFNPETYSETNLINYLDRYGVSEINEFFKYFSIPFKIKFNIMGKYAN